LQPLDTTQAADAACRAAQAAIEQARKLPSWRAAATASAADLAATKDTRPSAASSGGMLSRAIRSSAASASTQRTALPGPIDARSSTMPYQRSGEGTRWRRAGPGSQAAPTFAGSLEGSRPE